ncbi:hypothetical protein [Stakelama pacifica]|uniref:DUF4148 domain-containing protein n=1 Tax=Stakelama pacifica TaxID=517720 RepID=A0A4R6FRG8_9SPHN|nr:hypothetical protein [Stakelama pacifica]TDN83750.1 hypothetical protein EV664_104236 [Stakelama pacifica]GGO94720.1 hypothetical protein GCM10011329_17250 [Stakelama pacifica]
MKKFTLIIAGLGIATAMLPAAASAAPYRAGIERQIDRSAQRGALSHREARALRAEYSRIAKLEYRYRRSGHGISRAEARDLDRRYAALQAKVRYERQDNNRRPVYRR